MRRNDWSRRVAALSLALLVGCDGVMRGGATMHDEGSPTVAVLLDGSTSFLPWIDEAQTVVERFLARNVVNGTAKVFVYRIDRDSKLIEAIGQYDFIRKETKELIAAIKNPSNAPGTDIVGAIEQARVKLSQSGPGPKHMLVFTDGKVYAPRVDGKRLPFVQLEQYDWSKLDGIQTRFYFLDTQPYRILLDKAVSVNPEIKLHEAPEGADAREIMRVLEADL